MPSIAKLSCRASVREHLHQIVAAGPPHAHRDGHVPDMAVFDRQRQQLEISMRNYGAYEIAALYASWLDTDLADWSDTTGITS